MDAYVYQASLWCSDCIRDMLLERDDLMLNNEGKGTKELLEQVMAIYGYHNESDYDSDDLPKGPYVDGGGEADTPQHCDGCSAFLENPLTQDGMNYVVDKLMEHARGEGLSGYAIASTPGSDTSTLKQWADRYNCTYIDPLSMTLEDLLSEYALVYDGEDSARITWFDIAGELYTRGEDIPDEWKYSPGIQAIQRDSYMAPIVAAAPTSVLFEFVEQIKKDIKHDEAEEA